LTARDPNIEQDVRQIVQRIVGDLFVDEKPANRPADATEDSQPGARRTDKDSDVTVAVGGDHGGFGLKERILFRLSEQGFEVIDCGTDSTEAVDYPDIAEAVANKVASGDADVGVIVDGAGIGSAMVANKIRGVRAALCYDLSTAHNAREHNHANVLTLGAGLTGDALAWSITQEFLATPYGGGRHAARVEKIDKLDNVPMERIG